MRKIFVGFIVLGLAAVGTATAAGATPHKDHRFTIAVYGDAPYGNSQFSSPDTKLYDASPGFINTINGDPDVSLVAPVGDIHSGKEFCTEAYDTNIKALWGAFADPLVYTPGDNEWSDCHKPGEGGGKLSTAADGSKFIDLTAPAASATSTTRTVLRSTTSRSCVAVLPEAGRDARRTRRRLAIRSCCSTATRTSTAPTTRCRRARRARWRTRPAGPRRRVPRPRPTTLG